MPKHRNTEYLDYIVAAQRTIDLVDNRQMPDPITDVVLEKLIEMSAESRMQIWHEKTGLSLKTLAALYTLYEQGAGYRRVRMYGRYEVSRLRREDEERREREAKASDSEQS